jgi:predicted nucleic acid-binding protein
MAYLVDTDWIINALAGKRDTATILRQLSPSGVAVSLVTIGELYEDAFSSVNPEANLDVYRGFLAPFRKVTLTESIVTRFAEIRSLLRRRGEIIADFDLLIAATALDLDLTLLSSNLRHFRRVPDLRVYADSADA